MCCNKSQKHGGSAAAGNLSQTYRVKRSGTKTRTSSWVHSMLSDNWKYTKSKEIHTIRMHFMWIIFQYNWYYLKTEQLDSKTEDTHKKSLKTELEDRALHQTPEPPTVTRQRCHQWTCEEVQKGAMHIRWTRKQGTHKRVLQCSLFCFLVLALFLQNYRKEQQVNLRSAAEPEKGSVHSNRWVIGETHRLSKRTWKQIEIKGKKLEIKTKLEETQEQMNTVDIKLKETDSEK